MEANVDITSKKKKHTAPHLDNEILATSDVAMSTAAYVSLAAVWATMALMILQLGFITRRREAGTIYWKGYADRRIMQDMLVEEGDVADASTYMVTCKV